MDALREQAIEAGALVDLVEVGHRLPLEDRLRGALGTDRRPLGIGEHPFDEVAGREESLEALLILDADEIAAEALREPERGDVHPALREHLGPGQVGGLVLPEVEGHPRRLEPTEDLAGLAVGDLRRLVVEGRLTETLLENPGGVEETIGDDRVVHPHAALVEDPHEGLLFAELRGDPGADLLELPGHLHRRQRHDVARIMADLAGGEPRFEVALEAGAREVVGPERGVGDARLGERAVEVEHPDKARPLPRPIGDGEDGTRVAGEPGEDVVRVLPDSLGDDERRAGVDGGKHVDPLAGAGDEAMAAGLRGGVAANERPAGGGEGPRQIRFHLLLGRPADPIGLLAEVAAGDKDDVGFPPRGGRGLRAGGGGHDAGPKERGTESGEQNGGSAPGIPFAPWLETGGLGKLYSLPRRCGEGVQGGKRPCIHPPTRSPNLV